MKDRRQTKRIRKVQSALTHVRLKEIKPLTKAQTQTFQSYFEGQHLLLHGVAGSGKTFLAMYLGLKDLYDGHIEQIIVIRSAVSTREQGFLPGTIEEKSAIFEVPYADITNDLLQRGDGYHLLKTSGLIRFMTSSFVRGITFRNAIIILDEIQNFNSHEISSILTRVGDNCRVIACGDILQNDLEVQRKKEDSGITEFMDIARIMKEFDLIEFGINDIVRSGFVKSFIIAKMNLIRKRR